MFEDARRFLSRIRVWSNTGYTGIHYTVPSRQEGKVYWRGSPVETVDQAIRQLDWITRQDNTRDIYVALGSQRNTQTMTTKNGRSFQVALRSKENTVSFRTLFLDLDVKPGAYETRKDAVAALGEFIKATGIPSFSMAVASGTGGLHVYWVMDDDVPADEWYGMGLALANAGLQHGLKFDSQCSYDYTRVLRIPDTHNFKRGEPLPVQLLFCDDKDIPVDTMAAALEPFRGLKLIPQTTHSPSDWDSALSSGLEQLVVKRNIDEVAKQCAWVHNSLDTGGADNNNALRFLAYSLANFCENTDDVAWRMVCNRSTLEEGEFESTLDRVKESHATNPRVGFPRCHTIAGAGAMECRDCPLFGTIASPLSFSKPTPVAVEEKWTPCPPGYRMDDDGYYYRPEEGDDGQTEDSHVPILPKPIHQPWLYNIDGEWCLQFVTTKAGNEPMAVTIKLADTVEKNALGKALRSRALMSVRMTERVMDFMTSFIDLLQSAKQGIVDTKPFGWQKGLEGGFAFGGKNYNAAGIQPAPSLGDGYEIYGVHGSPEPWIEAAKAITDQGRPALDALLATTFAAPLVHLCGGDVEGFVIGGVSSHSGVGKTTTLNIAQAAWAHPLSAKMGMTDTINSVFGKAGNLRHLGLIWDEIKGERETKNFIQLLFQLTGGKEKSRMTRSATVREAKTWSTILTYGSNSSLRDALESQTGDTVAGSMRLFEFTVPPISEGTRNPKLNTLTGMLNENYGHAGAAYAEFIGGRQRELRERLADMRDAWMEETAAEDSERFWVAACATMLLGAELANEAGLTTFNLLGLRAFLLQEHKRMQTELGNAKNDLDNVDNLVALLGDYLASNALEYTITTNRIHEDRGAPRRGSIKLFGEGTSRIARIRGLNVHIGVENRLIRISDTSLGTWAHNRGIGKANFIKALRDHLSAKETKQRLGAGTDLVDTTPRAVIEIKAGGTPLDTYLDEVFAEVANEDAA